MYLQYVFVLDIASLQRWRCVNIENLTNGAEYISCTISSALLVCLYILLVEIPIIIKMTFIKKVLQTMHANHQMGLLAIMEIDEI